MGKSTFSEKLLLLLIDKFFIAIIVAIAGYLISKLLERYKSSQALFNEIAKKEIEKVSECWELAYESEAIIRKMVRRAAEIEQEYGNDPNRFRQAMINEITPMNNLSVKKTADFNAMVDKNRLWLGSELADNFMKFHNHLMDYLDSYSRGDVEQLQTAYSNIEKLKQHIAEVWLSVNSRR